MTSIGLTGSTGFVGMNLSTHLKENGLELQVISRDQLMDISLTDVIDCNVIVHLAGKAHDLKKSSDPKEYYKVNFELTKNLFDVFLKSKATKFIFISSVKASADSMEGPLTEEFIPNPKTDYGKSKLMAEEYIEKQSLPAGKSYFILRPCMIHGPKNKGNLNLLYKVVKKGFPYPLASFENKRSFLSISNLNLIIEKIIKNDGISSGVYNVSDDIPLSTNEVIEIIADAAGLQPKLWKVPSGLISFIAKIGDHLHLPLNSERLKKLTESYVVSNAKLKKALNLKE
ncbi:MAG: NAD-dependent epimerase/dehydratase family protein, partial [Candidatus Saccharimonadaceae bacterium]